MRRLANPLVMVSSFLGVGVFWRLLAGASVHAFSVPVVVPSSTRGTAVGSTTTSTRRRPPVSFFCCHSASFRKNSFRVARNLLDDASSSSMDPIITLDSISPWFLVVLALAIGSTAQGLINKQLEGDQGLGAFLQDGRGYSNSAFRPLLDDQDRAVQQDPLPWLKLPQLDFVEVAGQQQQQQQQQQDDDQELEATLQTLQELKLELKRQVALGNTAEAQAIQGRLEQVMAEQGITYTPDNNNDPRFGG